MQRRLSRERRPYEVGCEIQKKRLECAILVQAVLALEKEEAEEGAEVQPISMA